MTRLAESHRKYLEEALNRSKDAKKALSDYVDGGESLWFNRHLRNEGCQGLSAGSRAKLAEQTSVLNALIYAAPPLDDDIVVYRGTTIECLFATSDGVAPSWSFVGEMLSRGVLSTSTLRSQARDFVDDDANCCLFVIRLPRGTRALYVVSTSAWAMEEEVMLPHGTQIRIDGKDTRDGLVTFYGTVVSQTE